jgi:hypothetical protein
MLLQQVFERCATQVHINRGGFKPSEGYKGDSAPATAPIPILLFLLIAGVQTNVAWQEHSATAAAIVIFRRGNGLVVIATEAAVETEAVNVDGGRDN